MFRKKLKLLLKSRIVFILISILGFFLLIGFYNGAYGNNGYSVKSDMPVQDQLYRLLRWPALNAVHKVNKTMTPQPSTKVVDEGTYSNIDCFQSTYQGQKHLKWVDDYSLHIQNESQDIAAPRFLQNRVLNELANGNYIEVDIDHQMLLMYENHRLLFHTAIVSGAPTYESPKGIFEVISKHEGAVLSELHPIYGKKYQFQTDYWINFYQQEYGFHESKSHRHFGGQQFLKYGSLGCINIPEAAMKNFYYLSNEGDIIIII